MAKVVPIYKDGDTQNPMNYRPISVLSAISKVFEKIVNARFIEFLDKNNILAQEQYGFTKSSSTQAACLELINFISENVDRKLIVASMFLDLRKAFDSVDHDILLAKLQLILKLEPMQLLWFESYLRSRPQVVAVNQTESEQLVLSKGVPQGSILAPVLFNIYINDICSLNLRGKIQLYADDAVVKYSNSNLSGIFDDIQVDLNLINLWLNENRLQLNAKKTKYMLFTNKKFSDAMINEYSVSYGGVVIERVNSFKYLGLVLDNKLKWNNHVEMIKTKIRPYVFSVKRLKYILPQKSLLLIYNAFILPHLTYLNPTWGGCAGFRCNELEVLQKRTLKHIYHLPPRCSTVELFLKIPQLRLAKIIDYELLITTFKILKGLLKYHRPHYHTYDVHSYGTRQRTNYHINFFNTNSRDNNIVYKGLNAYNALSRDLKDIDNIKHFKRCIKRYLRDH